MRSLITLSALVLAVATPSLYSGVLAISTFDNPSDGVDGWTVNGDVASGPNFIATGGNPGGFIQMVDAVSGDVNYWSAPSKFLGNDSGAYGSALTFDLIQSGTDSQFDDSDIVLVGSGLTLAFNTAYNPGTTWTAYSVPLLASAGWKVNDLSGAAATEAQMQQVLGNLTSLEIRAEYRSGPDTDGLDNVVLNGTSAVPEPSTLALLGIGLTAVTTGRRFLFKKS